RPVLHDLDAVAQFEFVLLVVRLVAIAAAHVLLVDLVARATDDLDHHGLVHLVGDDAAEETAAKRVRLVLPRRRRGRLRLGLAVRSKSGRGRRRRGGAGRAGLGARRWRGLFLFGGLRFVRHGYLLSVFSVGLALPLGLRFGAAFDFSGDASLSVA